MLSLQCPLFCAMFCAHRGLKPPSTTLKSVAMLSRDVLDQLPELGGFSEELLELHQQLKPRKNQFLENESWRWWEPKFQLKFSKLSAEKSHPPEKRCCPVHCWYWNLHAARGFRAALGRHTFSTSSIVSRNLLIFPGG